MATIQRARLAGCSHCPRRVATLLVAATRDVIGLGPSCRSQRQFSLRVDEQRKAHCPAPNCPTTSLAVDNQENVIVHRFASPIIWNFVPSGSVVTRTRDYSSLASCQQGRRNAVWRGPCGHHTSTFVNCFLFSSLRSFSSRKHGQKPSSDIHSNEQKQSTHSTMSNPSSPSVTSDPPVWTWVERVLPMRWQPYARLARLDKPIGTMLLVRMN